MLRARRIGLPPEPESAKPDNDLVVESFESKESMWKDADGAFKGVFRSKGHVWLANAHAYPLAYHTAGRTLHLQTQGMPYMLSLIHI